MVGQVQDRDLDWGDGREVKLTWRPNSGPMFVSGGVRFGKTNGQAKRYLEEQAGGDACIFGGKYAPACEYYLSRDPEYYRPLLYPQADNHVDARAFDREEHSILDFVVGRDLGFGGMSRLAVSAGVRFARLESQTDAVLRGVPNWVFPEGSYLPGGVDITHTTYRADVHARREFEGWGPVLTWDAALPLLDLGEGGDFALEWSLSGGALFGDRQAQVSGTETEIDYISEFRDFTGIFVSSQEPLETREAVIDVAPRSNSATVPVAGASLGLSYEVGRFKAGAGYRWERYFDVLDVGYDEHQDGDRTIDGPYFKFAVGFGG